jgi:tetratricopeptide (TPR) repeat protein
MLFLFTSVSLSAASEKVPLRVKITLLKVAPLMERGSYKEAAEVLTEFREKREGPDDDVYNHAEINFNLGNCFALLERQEKAREHYQAAVNKNPSHLGGWQNLAKSEYELERYVPASDAFFTVYRLTVEEKKPEVKYLYYSAVMLLMDGRYDESIDKFMMVLKGYPEAMVPEWKENLVYALLYSGRSRQALPYMEELAEEFMGKKKQRWQELLLQHYMSLEMYKKAQDFVTKLTREAPTNPLWWKGFTHLFLRKGQYGKALTALNIYSYLTPLTDEENKNHIDKGCYIEFHRTSFCSSRCRYVKHFFSFRVSCADTSLLSPPGAEGCLPSC